jgi:hypothetical protein
VSGREGWIETEANGGHCGDQTLDRLGMIEHVRSVTTAVWRVDWGLPPARPITRGTGASGQVPEGQQTQRVDRMRWRVRSRSTGCVRSCVGAYWNRPDAGTVASSQFKQRVWSRGQQR